MSGVVWRGEARFNLDSGAIRLPGQGAGALLRVPHGQAGLRSARGPIGPMEKLPAKRAIVILSWIVTFG